MTLQQGRRTTGVKHTPPKIRPRLRLKPKAPASGYVDGAWWPRSDDLSTELPDLLTVLSVRLGVIDRVLYNLAEWAKAPTELPSDRRIVRLGGSHRKQVNTVEVIGANRRKIVLLVVPARTEPTHAHDIVMAAAAPNNASTVDGLLHG